VSSTSVGIWTHTPEGFPTVLKHVQKKVFLFRYIAGYFIFSLCLALRIPRDGKAIEELHQSSMPLEDAMRFELVFGEETSNEEEAAVISSVIEFYIPANFRRTETPVPRSEPAKVIELYRGKV
jgi:hypothetical protein